MKKYWIRRLQTPCAEFKKFRYGNLKFKHPEIPGGYKSTVLEILYAEKN